MEPKYQNGNVVANCPDCGVPTTFESKVEGNREFGSIVQNVGININGVSYSRVVYRLMRCAGCGRGGVAKIGDHGYVDNGTLALFYPISIENLILPCGIPEGIGKEFREAELDAASGAWRSASAMLRSTLEKILKTNGYTDDVLKAASKIINLKSRIDLANEDGIITDTRKKRAHDDIRVLGNDVLHEEWREVSPEEYEEAHKYTQRIIEDFYDDRATVEETLKRKGRLFESSEEKS